MISGNVNTQQWRKLANAYTLFDDSEAEQRLGKLAAMGSEPALVALAKT